MHDLIKIIDGKIGSNFITNEETISVFRWLPVGIDIVHPWSTYVAPACTVVLKGVQSQCPTGKYVDNDSIPSWKTKTDFCLWSEFLKQFFLIDSKIVYY